MPARAPDDAEDEIRIDGIPVSEPRVTGVEPAMLRRAATADFLGLSLRAFDQRVRGGEIPLAAFRTGKLRLWSVAELRAWAELGCPITSDWQRLWATISKRRHVG